MNCTALVTLMAVMGTAPEAAESSTLLATIAPMTYQQPYGNNQQRPGSVSPSPDDPWGFRDGRFGPRRGDWEVQMGGGGTTPHNFRSSTYNIDFSIGHFVTDHLSLAFRQAINFTDVGGSNLRGASRGAVDWHFGDGRFRPFVGVNFGGVYGDGGDSWLAGPEAGLKWFVHPHTYLFAMGEYQIFFDRIRDFDDNARRGDFVFTFGIGFLF